MDFPLFLYPPLSSIAPSRSSNYIQNPHRVVVIKSLLVIQHWHAHMLGSIEECHLWVHAYFSSNATHVLFISLEWFFEMGGKWLFLGGCFQNLFKIAYSILVWFQSTFFLMHFVSVHVVHPYSSTDIATTWKNSHFILLERSGFYKINSLLIALHVLLCICWHQFQSMRYNAVEACEFVFGVCHKMWRCLRFV